MQEESARSPIDTFIFAFNSSDVSYVAAARLSQSLTSSVGRITLARTIVGCYLKPRKMPSPSTFSAKSSQSMFAIVRLFCTDHISDGTTRNVAEY